jgi:hypothetical protein
MATLKRTLDRIFSQFIRERDRTGDYFTCSTCAGVKPYEQMDAGHFQNRRHLGTRYDEQNVHGQCRSCNRFDEGRQYEMGQYIDKKYGDGTAKKLICLARMPSKVDAMWYGTMIDHYKSELKRMKNARC